MTRLTLFVAAFALLFVIGHPVGASSDALSDDQKRAIEAVIDQYLRENPDVVIDAIQSYREREETAQRERTAGRIAEFMGSIDSNPSYPIAGNPDGSVTIVEFFDYRCGYCKKVFPDLKAVMAADQDVRLVFVEFPILGDDSVFAARAALAVWFNWPEQYAAYHMAMMSTRGALDSDVVYGEAAQLGIDASDLAAAMRAPEIDAAIEINYALAQDLSVNGTPAFIIGDELVPGAIERADFERLIAKQRQG